MFGIIDRQLVLTPAGWNVHHRPAANIALLAERGDLAAPGYKH